LKGKDMKQQKLIHRVFVIVNKNKHPQITLGIHKNRKSAEMLAKYESKYEVYSVMEIFSKEKYTFYQDNRI